MIEDELFDDTLIDERLAALLRETPEAAVDQHLAQRAMRLAAASPRAITAQPTVRWAFAINMIAAVAVAAVVLFGSVKLWALLDDSSASDGAADASTTSISTQSSSSIDDEIALGIAIILAAAGAQIVFRAPSEFPRPAIA